MGQSFWLQWFGKTLDELKSIKETQWDSLSDEDKEALDKLIASKENED